MYHYRVLTHSILTHSSCTNIERFYQLNELALTNMLKFLSTIVLIEHCFMNFIEKEKKNNCLNTRRKPFSVKWKPINTKH